MEPTRRCVHLHPVCLWGGAVREGWAGEAGATHRGGLWGTGTPAEVSFHFCLGPGGLGVSRGGLGVVWAGGSHGRPGQAVRSMSDSWLGEPAAGAGAAGVPRAARAVCTPAAGLCVRLVSPRVELGGVRPAARLRTLGAGPGCDHAAGQSGVGVSGLGPWPAHSGRQRAVWGLTLAGTPGAGGLSVQRGGSGRLLVLTPHGGSPPTL